MIMAFGGALAIPFVVIAWLSMASGRDPWGWFCLAALSIGVEAVRQGNIQAEIFGFGLAGLFFYFWYRNGGPRRMRRRLGELGAKSKRVLAAMAGKMRETVPRQVRPVPQGGGA